MTEEEKKAIKIVDEIAFVRGIRQDVDGKTEDLKAIEDVFRLVDNKQKEIEIYIENNAKIKQLKEEKKGKNLFNGNVIISKDNIPENMFISITKEQYAEYMQQKEKIDQQAKEIGIQDRNIHKLNLDKIQQQKEIEEMREELQMYVDTNLMKEKLEREIEKLKGIHKEFLKLHQELKAEDTFLSADNIIKAIRKNYISKYKIRELIKEIEKDELMQKLDFGQIKFTLKVLNELLEE